MRRLHIIGAPVLGVAASVIGGGLGVLFLVVVLGGGVYRTECTDNGKHTKGWDLGGSIPYLWSPGDDRCETHTLTRYALGRVGVMNELD